MASEAQTRPARIVKTYGLGSLLGILNPIFAGLMAQAGLRGWQASAIRQMEDDAVAMARRGYRMVDTRELGWERLGIVYYRVTYDRTTGSGDVGTG